MRAFFSVNIYEKLLIAPLGRQTGLIEEEEIFHFKLFCCIWIITIYDFLP